MISTIPSAIKTLLKSKVIIGDNAPAYEVAVEDEPPTSFDISSFTSASDVTDINNVNNVGLEDYNWYAKKTARDSKNRRYAGWSQFNTTSSKPECVVWYTDNNGDDWTNTSLPIHTDWYQNSNRWTPSMKCDSDDVLHLVFTVDDTTDSNRAVVFYNSYDGSSWSGWVKLNSYSLTGDVDGADIEVDDDDYIHIVMNAERAFTDADREILYCYSTNGGTSFTNWDKVTMDSPYDGLDKNYVTLAIKDNELYFITNSNSKFLLFSTTSKAWNSTPEVAYSGINNVESKLLLVNSTYWMVIIRASNKFREVNNSSGSWSSIIYIYNFTNNQFQASFDTWEDRVYGIFRVDDILTNSTARMFQYDGTSWTNALAPQVSGSFNKMTYVFIFASFLRFMYLYGTTTAGNTFSITNKGTFSTGLKINALSLSRDKTAGAQNLRLECANADTSAIDTIGNFSPESGVNASWANILLPGKEITLDLGYGSELVRSFTGELDDVIIDRTSQEAGIKLIARDKGSNLIDNAVKSGSNYYITYTSQTIEYIVNDLLTKAGFTSITTEATGITISEITFDRITYSDAIEQLIDISGFDLVIYEDSSVEFYKPNDRQPEQEDTITLNGTTPEELSEYPIVTASIQVWSGANKTGTQYTLTTDYTITEGDEDTPWEITRVGTGSISDGQTVYVSYVFAAYVFKEGVDIFSLGYKYSRRNMYGKIRVTGQDEDDNAVSYTYSLPSPSNYGVSADKVLFVDSQNLDTVAKCQAAANQLGANMIKKYREVNHVAIGVPWLQVGDTIKIVESSSGISESYRITGMTIELSTEGMFMTIKTNYYGYTP